MRVICAGLAVAAVLAAQDTSSYRTTTVDINGNRVSYGPDVTTTSSKTGSESTQLMRSVNGRMVPVERAEERVVREDASGKVVERTIRHYDSNGNPIGVEKVVIEERKDGAGNSTVTATKYGMDINGRNQVKEHSVSGNESKDNIAEYEVGATGRLELHGQTVTTAQKRANGSQEVSVDIYSKNVPGVINDTGSLQLKEHQIIERRAAAGDSVVETLSVQRPSVSDPKR